MSPLLASVASPRRPRTVVIADESVMVRGLFARWLGECGQFHVVAVAGDGETAIEHAARHQPDILVMDLDMPGIDGVTALPRIVQESPRTAVMLATTLTERNAQLALQCLTMGALDVLSKPDSRNGMLLSLDFRNEFMTKLGSIVQTASKPRMALTDWIEEPRLASGVVNLRPLVSLMPRYLVIGASTGGPRAVGRVLTDMGEALHTMTTLVVQHMPAVFTASFAEQIATQVKIETREPHDGERLCRGTVYIAPGGRHLGIDRRLGHIVASIDDSPAVRFCRPAVDVLFSTAARHLGPAALGLVLTGMGSDGTQGACALRQAGAAVIAQDESSSTIWGMPGSVVRAQHASAVIPLDTIGASIRALISGEQAA